MRVLFISRTFPPRVGGMETFASDFFQHCSKLDAMDLLVTSGGKRTLPFFMLRAMGFLVLRGRKYEVVHLYDAMLSPLIPFIRVLSGARISVTVNGLDIVYPRFGYQQIIPFFLRKADRVIAISGYTMSQCEARAVPSDRLRVIPNGIDPSSAHNCAPAAKRDLASKYGIAFEDRRTLLTVGRLIRRKGHAWFISEVLPKLPEDYIYVIAGSGPERDSITRLINELSLESRVHLVGEVSDIERNCLYGLAHAFVMPNISVAGDQEGFGIVALEAGLHGLPVVASDLEGIRDAVIPGKTGTLIKEQDARGFVDAIIGLHPESSSIRDNVIAHYDWTAIAQRYHAEFENMTSG